VRAGKTAHAHYGNSRYSHFVIPLIKRQKNR
jgi:hypothetical protein